MEYKIIERDEFTIVGLELNTTVHECQTDNKFPKLWDDFMLQISDIKNRVGDEFIGYSKSTGECSFYAMASVQTSDVSVVPEGMVSEVVPKSKYAVFTHKGKLTTLNDTYGEIIEFLPTTELKQKDIWLEIYDERFKIDSDDSEFDLYVAIE